MLNGRLKKFTKCLISLIVISLSFGATATADNSNSIVRRPPKNFRRYVTRDESTTLRFTPLVMDDGTHLTLIAPSEWSDLVQEISAELNQNHQQLTLLFGAIPPFKSSVRLLDEDAFYELTGAPAWTNAMFYRGEIIIPLTTGEPVDLENLHRSVKHEYSHAVLSALSGGMIPGWLDEGLAQWLEGEENPALRNSLRSYLVKYEPVPLALLQGGFTKLKPKMVPAAYAQSLIAVKVLLKAYGIDKISEFLKLLREPSSKDSAFEGSFGVTEDDFEERLHRNLRSWVGIDPSQTKRVPGPARNAPVVSERAICSPR